MKKVSTQFKNVITSAFGLLLAFCVAVFACYAWFTSSKQVNSSGISANVDEAFITDYSCTPYSLTFVSEDTSENKKTYTVGDAYSEESGLYSINGYDQTKKATLLEISYSVKDDSATMLKFSCDGAEDGETVSYNATATENYLCLAQYPDDPDNYYISTVLSNGVSLRLLDSSITNVSKDDTIFSCETEIPFWYPSQKIEGNYYKQQIFFNNATATNNNVKLYILMEYVDDNITMLYDLCKDESGYSLSLSIGLAQDITLSITHADDTLGTSGGTGTAAINDSGLSSVSYNLNSANQKSAANLITSTSKTTIAKALAAKIAAEDSSQNIQSTEIVSGAIRTTTYSMSYVADSAGGSTSGDDTDSSDNFVTSWTSVNTDSDSNVTFSNTTKTLKKNLMKTTTDKTISFDYAYCITNSGQYIEVNVSTVAKNTIIIVYASHNVKSTEYTLYISAKSADSDAEIAGSITIGESDSGVAPDNLYALSANLSSGKYYIWANTLMHVYAVVVSYSTVETIIY